MKQQLTVTFDYEPHKDSIIETFSLDENWQLKIGRYFREDMDKAFSRTLFDGLTSGKITGSELLALAVGGSQMCFRLAAEKDDPHFTLTEGGQE